ncbi:DUF3883 domain-containing protein [Sphingobium yanoikuyae]|uniref:DUF3883 domain-containing protein n=1 Tax=Sphingobium yanoikuyae TaxID=13690 RepID=UPI002FDE2F4C
MSDLDAGSAIRAASVTAQGPIEQRYEADLLGNIQQALAGLQGFEVMALELIQNADDAGAAQMRFDVRSDGLHVWNSASFSSCGLTEHVCPLIESQGRPCNFHAISRMGSRNKISVGSQIGRFGIGFVSVYQITDAPTVRSLDLELRLDPLRGRSPARKVAPVVGTEFELPWASDSSPTRTGLRASPTPDDVVRIMTERLRSALEGGLIFLRNLTHVELLVEGVLDCAITIVRDDDLLLIRREPDSQQSEWRIIAADARKLVSELDLFGRFAMLSELDRDTKVSVAVPLAGNDADGLVYAFLPTEQPTRLPFHVHADFFPRPDRRSIVLGGEQHDRHWNEAMLRTAAAAVAADFGELTGLLGARRLWALMGAAHAIREDQAFGCFWTELTEAACRHDCAWTVAGEWAPVASTRLAPAALEEEELAALQDVGIGIMHRDLRTCWSALQALGAKPLSLAMVVAGLEAHTASGAGWELGRREALWGAVGKMLAVLPRPLALQSLQARLKEVPFLADDSGAPASASSLRILPEGVNRERVGRLALGLAIADRRVLQVPSVAALVPTLSLAQMARVLASAIATQEDAARIIGTSGDDVRAFYAVLVALPRGQADVAALAALGETLILRTRDGFAAPARALLPGGFVDPIGHLAVVDTELMGPAMREFAETVLGVRVLSFGEFIRRHLDDLLNADPSRDQYQTLLREIAGHWHELASTGTLGLLREASFLRTRDGAFAAPADCYFRTPELEALLGEDRRRWVDEDWMPRETFAELQDLFETHLGMARHASIGHLITRIEHLSSSNLSEASSRAVNNVVRSLIDRMRTLTQADRIGLQRLRTMAWMPATLDGEPTGSWHRPGDVHRPFQAAGFTSQAPVADLRTLRRTQAGQALPDFLTLIGMPEVPPLEVVVAHLEHCMATGRQVSDVTYQMLSNGLDRPDAAVIERLRGRPFIWAPALKGFLDADHVFWEVPPFRTHWHPASPAMVQRVALYRALDVVDVPTSRHFAVLACDLAKQADRTAADLAVHQACLARLADAVDDGEEGAEEGVDLLLDASSLINIEGYPIDPADAVWCDADWLAAPFAGALDDTLVATPPCRPAAAARLFRALGSDRLSRIARLVLAAEPDRTVCEAANAVLAERGDLLLWLAADYATRSRLSAELMGLGVLTSATLQVLAELSGSTPPTRSEPSAAPAFYEASTRTLHVATAGQPELDWSSAFRALFSHLDMLANAADARHLPITALMIMAAPSRASAEHVLRAAGFAVPVDHSFETDDNPAFDAFEDAISGQEQESFHDDATEAASSEEGVSSEDPVDHAAVEVDDWDDEEPFGSKKPTTAFGKSVDEGGSVLSARQLGAVGGGNSSASPGSGAAADVTGRLQRAGAPPSADACQGGAQARDPRERQTRRSRLLAYVATNAQVASLEQSQPPDCERFELAQVDVAAIEAVLRYERSKGREPEEQAHNNPGFDIRSTRDGALERLIEVKGLASDWTERGVRLSSVQFAMAREHPDAFWIYVVENARDPERQVVHAIANPFAKVTEYWFDHGWRDVREETADARGLRLRVGERIRHSHYGMGVIERVEPRGVAQFVTIRFPIDGLKRLPFNSLLSFPS